MKNFKKNLSDVKMHITAGFNGMLPLIIVGAIGMALSAFLPEEGPLGELFAFLNEVGLDKFDIFVAMIIANSMSPRVGLASGFILGFYSNSLELGIFGGIVIGLYAGYIGLLFNKLNISGSNKALLSLVVVPLITSITGFFLVEYVISSPLSWFQTNFIGFLENISSKNAVLLAVILGLMFGFDLGGPVNKTGGLFAMISLTEGFRSPITYAVAAYMLPSMAAGLATMLDRKKELFDEDEHVQGPSIFTLGLLSLSEPALPMMLSDMKFMVPINMFCSALLTGLFALLGLESSLALGFISFIFMNKIITALLIFISVLLLHTFMILYRRKSLLKKGELIL